MNVLETVAGPGELSRQFRRDWQLRAVPLMNPDGVHSGNWRCNRNRVDLNRDWTVFRQSETQAVDYEDLVEQEADDAADDPAEDDYACPVSKCYGTALYMEAEPEDEGGDPAHWLCDCCGSMWFDKKNLMREINAIIDKYPYRAKRYKKVGKEWTPVEWAGDIMEYDDRVEKEARDRKTGRRRG